LPRPDESDFGEDASGESESDSDSESSGDGDGDESESDTGSTSCAQVVDSLTITNDTPPESVECVEQVLGDLFI
jgi:hypothetical protein